MTVIAGFSYCFFSVLLADSRLSASDGSLRRDVCQKMLPLGDAGLICWSGGLDAARAVMKRLIDRHRDDGPWWLLDGEETRRTLRNGYRPTDFHVPQVSLVAQIINPTRRSFEDETWPRIDMVTIDVEPFHHEVTAYGTRVRGSGDYIVPRIEEDNLFLAFATFSGARPDLERAVINKALFAQEIVERLIAEKFEPTIGGLYQNGYLLPDRVRVMSYEHWVSAGTEESYGTHVRLSVENGSFWQEHLPTNRRTQLIDPFTSPVEAGFPKNLVFDASSFSRETPGVIPTPNPLVASHFLSAHGVAERPFTIISQPENSTALGPEGIYRKVGPNPWRTQMAETAR